MVNANPDRPSRIAIFTADDPVWALPTWIKTIPCLRQEHEVVGIYLFPHSLGKLKGVRSYTWYLSTFGLWNFMLMSLYALKTRFGLLRSPISNWEKLAEQYGLQLNYASTPNSGAVIEWTKTNKIDIIFIMVNNILKETIIETPDIGIINKHAAILPSCKGIFPFFWGKLTGAPTGITFHRVDTGVDTGEILLQATYPKKEANLSMLRFYIDVHYLYPRLAGLAVNNLIARKYLEPRQDVTPGYYSLPTKKDYLAYRKKSFKVARFPDLFYRPTLEVDEILP